MSKKNTQKNAQVQTQVFTYLFVLIVISVTLLLGYRFIKGIAKQGEDISFSIFKQELEKDVKSVSYNYGEVDLTELELNKYYKMACFVDSNRGKALDNSATNGLDDYPLIKNAVESNTKDNVFLVVSKSKDTRFGISDIEIDNGFLCIDNNGLLKLRLEGMGNRTKIASQ